MKAACKCITLLYCLIIYAIPCHPQEVASQLKLHTDFIYINHEGKLTQDVFYAVDSSFKASLSLQCYLLQTNGDSILLYSKKQVQVHLKKGVNQLHLNYNEKDSNTYIIPAFNDVLKHVASVPPGNYITYITVQNENDAFSQVISNCVDSNLKINSAIRKDVNNTLSGRHRSFLGINIGSQLSGMPVGKALSNAHHKIEQASKMRGLTPVQVHANGIDYIDFYYHDWYVGRYKAAKNETVAQQLKAEESELNGYAGGLTANDLENHPSLFSQFRDLKKEKKGKEELKGELSLSGNFSNGQEPYSDQDNNYYELRGSVEVPVAGLPVELEGLYTSQDAHRQAKASYFHIHYDTDKAKAELNKLLSGYNEKYQQTISKGAGINMIYGSALNNLQAQKGQLQAELQAQLAVPDISKPGLNLDSLKQAATQKAMSAAKDSNLSVESGDEMKSASTDEQKIKDSVNRVYSSVQEKYNKLLAIEKNIDKYSSLLQQYKNTNYFDSALAYQKIKNINETEDLSYKQLAKKADNLLPEGKAKSFATGITNFDAGSFPMYESKFTMAGQNLKGLNFGYDLGFCQAGFTLGKTQYIGPDGSIDQYTTYSANASFKPAKNQKIGLIYYGYMPSKQMLSGDFFKDLPVATPTFTDPVHIVSLNYDARLSRYLLMNAEAATSINDATSGTGNFSAADKMAYNFDVQASIPGTYITIGGNYSKAGKDFQNNSLPISPAGTEQYQLQAQGDFFRSFLSLGVEYDYLLQSNFASSGGNKKWGFNVQTHSRKYPSLSFSYKPFTTFRSYSDTLSIAQRPLIGSVWSGKASYQLKRHDGTAWRFMLLYNKSSSSMDTTKYGTDLLQATCMYSTKKLTLSLSGGEMQMFGALNTGIVTTPNQMRFISASANYMLNKQIELSGGQDLGFANFGFCRYAINGGVLYRFNKLPLMLRVNLRYNDYELNQEDGWKQLYSGNIELTWRFKTTIQQKNN
ncbi:MAG: hypothetical protein JSS96_01985 [Bacteroidetes bacterium]|nr:hypothetical protein [Bacteroidota bacterium]